MHVVFHLAWLAVSAVGSHAGFECLLIKNVRILTLGLFYHQLHHRFIECNYGTPELPADKLFGTFNDGTEP